MSNLGFGFYATHPGEVLKDELEARGILSCTEIGWLIN